MGLRKYEQEIAAAAAHPDREHAVTVLESLARSLRRHEWPAERRAAAYDLATRAADEARRLAPAVTSGPALAARLFDAARRGHLNPSGLGWAELTRDQKEFWLQLGDQEIAAAQEIANREGYPVHVGCGGEVWGDRHGRRRCHSCDLAVPSGEVVEPG